MVSIFGTDFKTFNSTRYIRNEGHGVVGGGKWVLSTPHGTLGTPNF